MAVLLTTPRQFYTQQHRVDVFYPNCNKWKDDLSFIDFDRMGLADKPITEIRRLCRHPTLATTNKFSPESRSTFLAWSLVYSSVSALAVT